MAKIRKKTAESGQKRDKTDKPEWAQFFEGQVEGLPFYSQFSKKGKKKK